MEEFLSQWFGLAVRVRNWHEIKAHAQLAELFYSSFGNRMSEKSRRVYWRPLMIVIGFRANELKKKKESAGDFYADQD